MKLPDLKNTIVALDNSGRTTARVKGVFYALTEADTNDEMSALSEKIAPVLSEHNDNIYLNQDLYKRVAAVWQQEQEGKITLTTGDIVFWINIIRRLSVRGQDWMPGSKTALGR